MTSTHPPEVRLRPIEAQLSWRGYLAELWVRRDYLLVVPRQDARSKQMTNLLGQAWHLLNPALMILIYFFIFGVVLDGNRGVEHYLTFLTVGILSFQLIQRIVVDASTTIHRQIGLVRTIQFPRALLPLSDIIEHAVAFVPTIGLLYVVAVLDGADLRWHMVLLPVTLLPVLAVAGGSGLLAARVGASVPDMKDILPHLFRLLLYTSGIIFVIDEMISSSTARLVLKANPVYLCIAFSRWTMLETPFSINDGLALLAWSLVLPVVGLAVFRANEQAYGA